MSTGSNLHLTLTDLFNDQVGLTLQVRDVLHSVTSAFQRIAVYDTTAFGRVLTLGGSIALTDLDEAAYAEQLVHPALAAAPHAKRVLIIGGGDGGLAREVLRYPNIQQVTVVEIDRQVVEVCKAWFPRQVASLADPRVEVIYDDAHRWLRSAKDRFDVVLVDGSELVNAPSDAFFATRFADTVVGALADKGILVVPLGNSWFEAEACRTTLGALALRFPKPRVYAITLPSLPAGEWTVAWCSATQDPLAKPALPTGVDALTAWHPELQARLFAVPRHVQVRLGLPG